MELREIVQTAQARINAARSALNAGDHLTCPLELAQLANYLLKNANEYVPNDPDEVPAGPKQPEA